MDDIDEEMILSKELQMLMEETVRNHKRVESGQNAARARMALAQVVQMQAMMQYYIESEYDWRDFKEKTVEVLGMQYEWYREGRADDDRDKARIALSRVRLIKTLIRRLSDQDRREAIASTFQAGIVWQ